MNIKLLFTLFSAIAISIYLLHVLSDYYSKVYRRSFIYNNHRETQFVFIPSQNEDGTLDAKGTKQQLFLNAYENIHCCKNFSELMIMYNFLLNCLIEIEKTEEKLTE